MNLETKITIYKFTPQLFTLTLFSFIDYFILKNAQAFALYLLIVMHSSQKRSTFAALNLLIME